MQAGGQQERILYLDYVRAWIVVAGVVCHCVLPYLEFINFKWIVMDPAKCMVGDFIALVSDTFYMAMLFFFSGYLSLPSLRRRSLTQFALTRIERLGVPFVFGLCVLCPVMTYVRELAKGKDVGSYFSYWLFVYFNGKMYAGWLWFLSTLLFITVGFAVCCAASSKLRRYLKKTPQTSAAVWLPSPVHILFFCLAMSLGIFVIAIFTGEDHWVRIGQKGIITFQPTRLPVYIGYFVCGVLAARSQWRILREPDSTRQLLFWGAAAAFFITTRIAFLYFYYNKLDTSLVLQGLGALSRSFSALSLCVITLGVFKKWCNSPSRWMQGLAADSLAIYVVNTPIVVLIQLGFLQVQLPALAKICIVSVLGVGLSWLAARYVLRRGILARYF